MRSAWVSVGLVGEVLAQRGEDRAVAVLPADHRTVELPARIAPGALDADAPGQLLDRAELEPPVEAGRTAVASAVGPAGPDAGRVEGERAEQPVDVVGRAGLARARTPLVPGDEPIHDRPQGPVLGLGQEVAAHAPGQVIHMWWRMKS